MAEDRLQDAQREKQIRCILDRIEAELRKDYQSGVRPLHEIEEQISRILDSVKKEVLKEISQELSTGYAGSRTTCPCGGRAKYCGSPLRQMVTIHGVLDFRRSYYYCHCCRNGFCPLDRDLQIDEGACSRLVQALLVRFCSHMSFDLAARELEVVCGVRLSATTMQTYSKKIGVRIAEEWERHTGRFLSGKPQSPSGLRVKRLYVSMDGVMAHIGGEWREVKLGATFQRSNGGRASQTRYYASLEKSHIFGPKVRSLAHMSGADSCSDIVMLGDGAPWIWQETGKYFPRSTQILDYYHVTEHLAALSMARFGADTIQSRLWLKQQKDRLISGHLELIINDIQDWKPRKKANRDIRRKLIAYLCEHRQRMSYKTLTEQGYYIGSGVIEAGAKSVVKARMGAAGMRWEEPGAHAMLHISAHWKTASNDGFFKYTQ
jgi:hypothetical protein